MGFLACTNFVRLCVITQIYTHTAKVCTKTPQIHATSSFLDIANTYTADLDKNSIQRVFDMDLEYALNTTPNIFHSFFGLFANRLFFGRDF
jgi:hypothetical protein